MPVCGQDYNFKGVEEKFFGLFKLCCSFTVAHFHRMMHTDPAVVGGGDV